MTTVTSKDGTSISYTKQGQGAPLILVDGALCHRNFGPMPGLAALLTDHFTVFTYDRRGRGESGDTLPSSVEREIEDIEALITEAGGSAYIHGTSSGAVLAMLAVASGLPITKLSMYEPPLNDDPNVKRAFTDYSRKLNGLLAENKRGDAAALFMSYVGTPPEAIEGMKHAPVWGGFEAVAPTLAYDANVMVDGAVPLEKAARVKIPTLIMTGGATLPFMHVTAQTLQQAIPNAQYKVLEGQTHDVASDVIAPELIRFFQS